MSGSDDWENWDEDEFDEVNVQLEDAKVEEPEAPAQTAPTGPPKPKKPTKLKKNKKKKKADTEENQLSKEEEAKLAKYRYEQEQFELVSNLVSGNELNNEVDYQSFAGQVAYKLFSSQNPRFIPEFIKELLRQSLSTETVANITEVATFVGNLHKEKQTKEEEEKKKKKATAKKAEPGLEVKGFDVDRVDMQGEDDDSFGDDDFM